MTDQKTQTPSQVAKKARYRAGVRIAKIRLDYEMQRLQNILHREIEKLLVLSRSVALLDKDSTEALIKYVRLVKDLKKLEREEEEDMSEEDLAKIAGVAKS